MSTFGKAFIAGIMIVAPSIGLVAAAEAQPPIRIGASASKTGTYAALGQNQLRGYQLCVKHTNEKGGVLGRRLELVVEDDQSQSATAIRIYERLITQEKVDLVLGPYGSPMTEPVINLTEKYRMPMVAATVGTTSIFKKGRKFISMGEDAVLADQGDGLEPVSGHELDEPLQVFLPGGIHHEDELPSLLENRGAAERRCHHRHPVLFGQVDHGHGHG